jgi:2,5-diketo-D-gluconate reductase A
MPTNVPSVTLNNDIQIPQVGFGVFQIPPEQTHASVTDALEVGYRHIDTAKLYQNERAVGAAIRDFGLPAGEVFVTTKCWNTDQGYDAALRAFDRSAAELGLEQVDLYLIHWPVPSRDAYVGTWKALEKLYADGRVRAIGVSNFQVAHLQRLMEQTQIVPAVNQIELHPWLPQDELRAFGIVNGIVTQAWSPLARGGDLLRNTTLRGLADKHGRSVAQIVLRWHIQLGNVVLPRTVRRARAIENLSLFDFELDDTDMQNIRYLDTGQRIGPDPDTFGGE